MTTLHPDHERRITAAWAELGQRMTQRQSVIQIYMTVVITIFGFYFSQKSSAKPFPTLPEFFLLSITMMTFISCSLIGVHDRVITKLKRFMATCEQNAFLLSNDTRYVFYFSDEKFTERDNEAPASFHNWNQYAQKGAFFATFLACNMTAIILASNDIKQTWVTMVCFTTMIFGLGLLLTFEFVKNGKIAVEETQAGDDRSGDRSSGSATV